MDGGLRAHGRTVVQLRPSAALAWHERGHPARAPQHWAPSPRRPPGHLSSEGWKAWGREGVREEGKALTRRCSEVIGMRSIS